MYNINDYGAVSGGSVLCTNAIQEAIDSCADAGGGCVYVPAGIYKTGTIWMKSNVELHLEMGATLLASDDLDDYNDVDDFEQNYKTVPDEGWVGKHLIIALEQRNIAITGFGVVDGNCYAYVYDKFPGPYLYCWRNGITELKDKEKMRPGQLICLVECSNIFLKEFSIHNSPCWSCYLLGCENAIINGIKIKNPVNMLNSDGIDIDTSRFVTVSNCIIDTGDDAITLRCCEEKVKNKTVHCEYITISNCVLSTSVDAFRIGVGTGTIRHVCISNISIRNANLLADFNTSYAGSGCAKIEDIKISNISMAQSDRLVFVNVDSDAMVKNITFDNIYADVTSTSCILCNKGGILENMSLSNINMYISDRYDELTDRIIRERGSYIFHIKNGEKIEFSSVNVYGTFTECLGIMHIENCFGFLKNNCNF